jgi:hypothetical protein
MDIFSDRFPTITFGNIPVDRVSRSDRLPYNPFHFERRGFKQATSLNVQGDCIFPDT